MNNNDVSIIGAGLIGSLLGIFLQKRGLSVSVYEKRPDLRLPEYAPEGRSINMALSDRGWKAIDELGLRSLVEPYAIPMYGRRIHDEHGDTTFLPYGKENQAIYSISRGKFNHMLVDEAEKNGVQMKFDHHCKEINITDTSIVVQNPDGSTEKNTPGVIIGADGAYSSLRDAMQHQTRLNYTQEYISHGYKELSIPPTKEGEYAMDPNALHIWPRGMFMLIALPNPDKSFTCTLFLPFEGAKVCFAKINDRKDLDTVFKTYFDDAYALMPDLAQQYFDNPTSSLINVECYPWLANKSMLIGDACHAMVPFFGQGMNCGFEDCYILDGLLEKYGATSWELVFEKFQKIRKKDTDAISKMARDNFTEMRDSVANPKFLVRKKIEAKLHELYPNEWIPLYTMVTFSDMKYADAYAQGKLQDEIMDRVMDDPTILQNYQQLNYEEIIRQVDTARMV
ncbi:kynurenine 3-monooxygenase [Echinicola pacifica]|uniref:Kynurenine 3-monooxygenase n=1 Tax=Echinicola pacifica TaxID=346377 RepID=A0A918UL50_9BACT|nr:NAD(P)/FAD-dependent oxidoreductase [Echinicola pacifica]GGZ18405.1 kynurenine 3-monooxygenase [Echinicola pacifica]